MNKVLVMPLLLSCLVLTGLGLSFVSLTLSAQETIQPTETTLSKQEEALVAWIDEWQHLILEELELQVGMNTGTDNIEGLDQYRDYLQAELDKLGFKTERHSSQPISVLSCAAAQVEIADHLVGSIEGNSKKRILLNGHMDTVFSKEDEFQSLTIYEDGTLTGPGVADMKGGIVIMLYALRALKIEGLLEHANITVLLNSDEEIGSLGSRALIEELAKEHDLGLVFEGSYENHVTRSRKGLGQARLKVTGRESHAGGSHEEGVSANLELAHKIIEIEKLTDYQRQVTVNTGVMTGGEKRNTVPGCADAYVDMRFPSIEEGEKLMANIKEISSTTVVRNPKYPALPAVEAWAVLHRPAKQVHPKVDELIAQAMGLSQLLGEPIIGARYSGGGTDGSIAQSVGLPTMDSLGMDGTGAHSSREASTVRSLIARAKLATIMLARQIDYPINK